MEKKYSVSDELKGRTYNLIYKMDIAFKEAKETRYWLQMIIDAGLIPEERVSPDLGECVEIIKILSTIIYRSLKREKARI